MADVSAASAAAHSPAYQATVEQLAIVMVIGAGGGLLAGLLGMGGAVLMLPALTTFAGLTFKEAAGATVVQVAAAGIVGWLSYRQQKLVHVPLALQMGLASAAGGLAGGYASGWVPEAVLAYLFLVVVLGALALLLLPLPQNKDQGSEVRGQEPAGRGGARTQGRGDSLSPWERVGVRVSSDEEQQSHPLTPALSQRERGSVSPRRRVAVSPRRRVPASPCPRVAVSPYPAYDGLLATGLGVAQGLLAGLLGAGGGFLIVPLLVGIVRVPLRLAIGTSLVVVLLGSSSGLIGKLLAGQIQFGLAAALVAGAGPATWLGTQLNRRLPARGLRALLAAVLLLSATRVLTSL